MAEKRERHRIRAYFDFTVDSSVGGDYLYERAMAVQGEMRKALMTLEPSAEVTQAGVKDLTMLERAKKKQEED